LIISHPSRPRHMFFQPFSAFHLQRLTSGFRSCQMGQIKFWKLLLPDNQSHHVTKLAHTNPFPVSRMYCESIPLSNPPLYFFDDSEKKIQNILMIYYCCRDFFGGYCTCKS
jgi:hypothetical protein